MAIPAKAGSAEERKTRAPLRLLSLYNIICLQLPTYEPQRRANSAHLCYPLFHGAERSLPFHFLPFRKYLFISSSATAQA
jgi:hypothetical protein